MSSSVSADDSVVDEINITVPTSCSLEGTGMTSHNANIVNGTYQGDIGSTTLKAFCNDADGFAIYAIGYTDNEYGKTVLTNTTLGSTHDIVTGTATSGNTSNWAMKLATVTNPTPTYPITLDNSFNAYHNVPSTYTKVAHRDSGTDIGTNATGTSLTSTYAAFMSQTQPAGTYTGQVKYTLVHPSSEKPVGPLDASDCTAGYICYAPNVDDIEGSMNSLGTIASSATAGRINVGTDATEAILIAPNYSRNGYGFAGWSTDFAADSGSVVFGPNETITLSSDNTGDANITTDGLILYPVWLASSGSIQNWSGCSGLTQAPSPSAGVRATLASMTALTDVRDNNTYAVARLADGNCWMVENLRLDDSVTAATISSGSQGVGGYFTKLPASVDTNWNSNTSNDLYGADTSTYPNADGNTYYRHTLPQFNGNNTNRSLTANYNGNGNSTTTVLYQWYSYGNYYSWPAAIANTTLIDDSSVSDTVGTSICPSGWQLPYGNYTDYGAGSKSYYYLNRQLGGTNTYQSGTAGKRQSKRWRQFPNNFVFSGLIYGPADMTTGSYIQYRSTSGFYSTTTVRTPADSYYMQFGEVYIYPGTYSVNSGSKFFGSTVRCVISV